MTEVIATVKGSTQSFYKALEKASLGTYHSDIYLNIGDGEVRTIVGSPGNIVVSYCDFNEGIFESVEGEAEVIVGVERFFNYLDLASSGGVVTVDIATSNEDDRLADLLQIHSDYDASIRLATSESVLEEVPLGLANSFDEDNVMMNQEGEKLRTHIEATSHELHKIYDVVDLREDVDFYPIVVEDSVWKIDVGNEGSESFRGVLSDSVEGPDVSNTYNEGFQDLVSTLSGNMRLSTDDEAPLSVVQEREGMTIRHSLGEMG